MDQVKLGYCDLAKLARVVEPSPRPGTTIHSVRTISEQKQMRLCEISACLRRSVSPFLPPPSSHKKCDDAISFDTAITRPAVFGGESLMSQRDK